MMKLVREFTEGARRRTHLRLLRIAAASPAGQRRSKSVIGAAVGSEADATTPQVRRGTLVPLFAEITVTDIGYFGVGAILLIHLITTLELAADVAAAILMTFFVFLRIARVLIVGLVNRLPIRATIISSLLICAFGYLGLAYAEEAVEIAVLLVLVGLGYGVNGTLVWTLTSQTQSRDRSALSRFAALGTAANFAAAIGPVTINFLRLEIAAAAPFYFAASTSFLAAVIACTLPARLPSSQLPSNYFPSIVRCIRLPGMPLALVCTAMGWVLHTQLFAMLPLFAEGVLESPQSIGYFFVAKSVIVIVMAVPLSYAALHLGLGPGLLVALGFAFYGCGFFALEISPSVSTAYGSVVLWALGEAVMMPAFASMLARATPPNLRLVGFSLQAAAMGVGEGVGTVVGTLLIARHVDDGSGHPFLVMSAIAAGFLFLAILLARRQASPIDEDVQALRSKQRPTAAQGAQILRADTGLDAAPARGNLECDGQR